LEGGKPVHALFTDKGYIHSTDFELSTSQMPWGVEDTPGFGAYSSNAYGVCYRFSNVDTISATITSRRTSNGGTKDAIRFARVIKQSMHDMMALLRAHPDPTRSRSAKL
jgi:hypothetical protein